MASHLYRSSILASRLSSASCLKRAYQNTVPSISRLSGIHQRRWQSTERSKEENNDGESKQEAHTAANGSEEEKVKHELQKKDKQIAELQVTMIA